MKTNKVLITGIEGLIASEFTKNSAGSFDVKHTSLDKESTDGSLYLDLTKAAEFNYDQVDSSTTVLHLAAVSSPDMCKNNPKLTHSINIEGSTKFISGCIRKGANVLFFSSDTVYGPTTEPATESSTPNPAGEYAQMKRTVERTFENDRHFKVFRLSYVFSKRDKFTSYICDCAKKRLKAEVYHPLFRNIVYINDVIDCMSAICKNWNSVNSRRVNLCGPELLSRVDLAEMLRKRTGMSFEMIVKRPPPAFFHARPETISMESLHLQGLLRRTPTRIEEAIDKEFMGPASLPT